MDINNSSKRPTLLDVITAHPLQSVGIAFLVGLTTQQFFGHQTFAKTLKFYQKIYRRTWPFMIAAFQEYVSQSAVKKFNRQALSANHDQLGSDEITRIKNNEKLDEALKETFPASDPISIGR